MGYIDLIIWFLISVLLGILVYRNAEGGDMEPALWLLIVLLTGPIGLLIYVVIRE